MSEDRWQLKINPTAAEAYEAMVLAGKATVRGKRRVPLVVHGIFVGFFAPIGAVMIFWVLVRAFGGPDMTQLPTAAVPLTLLAFGALAVWLMRRIYIVVAEVSVTSRFGKSQEVVLAAEGITLSTAHSRWHSGWSDVSAVRAGKKTIAVVISGIAIPLPHRSFVNPPDAQRALAVMQRWQESAS